MRLGYPFPVPLVIDTYNVLHVTGVLPAELAVGSPEELAALIERSRFGREAVRLVCDGVPRGASRVGRIVIEGAGPGRSADAHVAELLERHSAPRRFTVVTSDRAVARHAKSRGADCIRSEEFLGMLAEDARRSAGRRSRSAARRPAVPLSETEVEGWMRLFEITAEQAAIEAADAPRAPPSESRDRPVGRKAGRADGPATRLDALLGDLGDGTRGLDDPLAILDAAAGGRSVEEILGQIGRIDDATLETLMARHEPRTTKGARRAENDP